MDHQTEGKRYFMRLSEHFKGKKIVFELLNVDDIELFNLLRLKQNVCKRKITTARAFISLGNGKLFNTETITQQNQVNSCCFEIR